VAVEVSQHDRKRSVRRTALWLALLAAMFYVGFIALGVWQSLR
jgi:cytochrome oxidase assembly protein ShyY1